MIVYFAGNGIQLEERKLILKNLSKNWGILLSYKDIRTKDKEGSKRFKKIIK